MLTTVFDRQRVESSIANDTNAQVSTQARVRQNRAFVARKLLELHRSAALEDPHQWSWQRLSHLPKWCLLAEGDRLQLQLTSGALVRAPELALWIDGRALSEVARLIGQTALEQLLLEARAFNDQTTQLSGTDGAAEQAHADPMTQGNQPDHAPIEAPSVDQVQDYLLRAGSSVLYSSIDKSLPVERLAASLGPGIGDLGLDTALAIVMRAEILMETPA